MHPSASKGPEWPVGPVSVPKEPLGRLFLRFLRFGALAWGGPVAQIAMIRQEFVDEERWVTGEQFNRALAVYQILPGPEAHELCVYFGMLSRGRAGGVLAGLGFMLPGFVLMFALSWAYVRYGLKGDALSAVFAAVQVAVAALIVRAVIRIGGHVVTDQWLWVIGILATAAQLVGFHFGVILIVAGVLYVLTRRARKELAWFALALAGAAIVAPVIGGQSLAGLAALSSSGDLVETASRNDVSLATLFWSGLKAGLLTFGGAYTVIPFLQRDAVAQGAWMSNTQFLDGLALSGLLPAPLIIFATFVGYLGGGPWGAVVLTLGIFLPAFSFTLVGHDALERMVHEPRIALFLAGVTAGVVGLIAGTTIALLTTSLTSFEALVLFALALAALFVSSARLVVPALIGAAAVWGLARFFFLGS